MKIWAIINGVEVTFYVNIDVFQFIIPKAKVTSENTITLEAEGDPSTFSMNLTVLRPDDGSAMMKLVKYSLDDAANITDEVGKVNKGDSIAQA